MGETKRFINTKIWRDPAFTSLDFKGKILLLYLATNPDMKSVGIMRFNYKTAQIDLDFTREEIEQSLSNLEGLKMIERSTTSDELLLYDGLMENANTGWVYDAVLAKELKSIEDRGLLIKLYDFNKTRFHLLPKNVQPFAPYFQDPTLIDNIDADRRAVREAKLEAKKKIKPLPAYYDEDQEKNKPLTQEQINEILEKRSKREANK